MTNTSNIKTDKYNYCQYNKKYIIKGDDKT